MLLNYNEPESTYRALCSIRQKTGKKYSDLEVIVVDNGGSKKIAKTWLLDNEIHLDLPNNVFFGEGNNLGAEISSRPNLIFANNDISLRTPFIRKFSNALANEDVGIAGCVFVNSKNDLIEAGGFIGPDGHPIRAFSGVPLSDFQLGMVTVEPDYVSAAFMAIKKNLFFELGGFDMAYEPAYYEDTDLCFSAKKTGHKIVLTDVVVEHNETFTNAKRKNRIITAGASEKGRMIFMSRWMEDKIWD